MSAEEAVDALERLGLSSYEAKVFVALQRLGGGTAQEVSDVGDVPRSQVYGAADELAERGLVEQVESSPKRYRPVSLAAAREQLRERVEREHERAFESLSAVRREADHDAGGTEVATLRGSHPVRERVADLISGADERVIYVAPSERQVTEDVAAALRERAVEGLEVTLVTEESGVAERFADDPVFVVEMDDDDVTGFTGRTLLVDEATVLLSVVPEADAAADETAMWTADTSIARILAQFVHAGMQRGMERSGGGG